MQVVFAGTPIRIIQGDLTRQDTDAVVNAANSGLMGGGGVDGAIHRAGGPEIRRECARIVAAQGPLPPGRAVLTTGGRLPARCVIHTVGPVWRGGNSGERDTLAECYRSCLRLAAEHGLKSLSFPSIGTGAYGFPIESAAPIALGTVLAELPGKGFAEIRFVLYTAADLLVYEIAWRGLCG